MFIHNIHVLQIISYPKSVLVPQAPLLAVVAPLLDLHGSLAHDAGSAAEGSPNISSSVSLYVVPLPGLLPEEEGGDAGHEAAQQSVQQPTLPQVISCGICKARGAAQPTAAYPHVSTTAAQALLPLSCHFQSVGSEIRKYIFPVEHLLCDIKSNERLMLDIIERNY